MANDIYQIVAGGSSSNGNHWANVFHYERDEVNSPNPFQHAIELLDAFVATNVGQLESCLSSVQTIETLSAKRVNNGGGASSIRPVNLAGSISNDSGSTGLCLDIAWIIGPPGNRAGHTYIAGVPGNAIDNDVFTTFYIGLANTFANAMLTDLVVTGGHARFGTYTRKLDRFNLAINSQVRPKPTLLNKRTLPRP